MGSASGIHGKNLKNRKCFGGEIKIMEPLRIPICRWENDLKDIGWENVDCVNLSQDRTSSWLLQAH